MVRYNEVRCSGEVSWRCVVVRCIVRCSGEV